ncbi:hypothetical protein M404DRAFT_1003702 [Pisolithus tinctorius Marx 270]|uniref:Uncharacterized protein n=1 Tax=Pisolithus tinctorius Marx 270 TaxID=870435 RepID=A0A0C3JT84_PISTI|nr:hypothetical protein M404DRAFT_1003702 [Pisolithus tinctorius Marx 270]
MTELRLGLVSDHYSAESTVNVRQAYPSSGIDVQSCVFVFVDLTDPGQSPGNLSLSIGGPLIECQPQLDVTLRPEKLSDGTVGFFYLWR